MGGVCLAWSQYECPSHLPMQTPPTSADSAGYRKRPQFCSTRQFHWGPGTASLVLLQPVVMRLVPGPMQDTGNEASARHSSAFG